MPLTDELGQLAMDALQRSGRRLTAPQRAAGGRLGFEAWLSVLADDQPQLSEAENRDNAALFAHIRDAVATELSTAQQEALAQPLPGWLYAFVRALHAERATVLTLNYDVLVEAAVDSHTLWAPRQRRHVTSLDVLENLPRLPDVGTRLYGPLSDSFRLLKLHGSLDWWSVPNDASGATLNREDFRPRFGDPLQMSGSQRRRELPGRERFVVPPLSTKSAYYRNPFVRELWRQASEAIGTATRISLVGYSLPQADLSITSMLSQAFDRQASDIVVDIVNPAADELASRLGALGAQAVEPVTGEACAETFTDQLTKELAAALAQELGTMLRTAGDAALAVAWGDTDTVGTSLRRVLQISERDDQSVVLELEHETPRHGATGPRFTDEGVRSQESVPTAADLLAKLDLGTRLIASAPEGDYDLIDAWEEGRNVGASPRWIFFAPAAPERSLHEPT